MKFLHLIDLSGQTVAIPAAEIEELRPAEGMGHGTEAKTIVVLVSGMTQAVRETIAEIEAKVKDD